ncbi:hypothetical protein [Devosia sp. A449]
MPSPTFTRRALIAGAGTAVASAAIAVPYVIAAHSAEVCGLPVDTASNLDAEIHTLFADWRATYVLANDSRDDAALEKLWAIEDQMAALRPATVTGFAIKLLVMTAYDEFDLDSDRGKTLFADAIAITGQPTPVLAPA